LAAFAANYISVTAVSVKGKKDLLFSIRLSDTSSSSSTSGCAQSIGAITDVCIGIENNSNLAFWSPSWSFCSMVDGKA
jgi:hypothetical protein